MTGDERLFSRAGEAAVLGSMIVDPPCIEKVLAFVFVEDFTLSEHKIIFQTVLDLRSKGEAIDGLLVRSALEANGQLERIGGVEYLAEILQSVPSSANVEFYAKVVKEKSKLRKLVETGNKIRKIIDSTDSAGEGVFQVQQIAAGLDGALEPCGDSQPIIKELADVEPLPINWFWFNRIPLGMLTLVLGDSGLGKSFLTLYMAAKVSTGGTWPDGDGIADNSAPLGSVVILSAEDDLAHVIRPRLDSLSADVDKIKAVEGVRVKDEEGRENEEYFNLQHHIPALQKAVRSCKDCKLLIVDPLSAYLGGKIDSHKDSDVRSVLAPLVELAEEKQIAIIGVMHLNKNTTGKVVYRAMGSIAFTAAARTVWLVSTDPNDPDSRRRLLTPAKHNILIEPTGLAFEINGGRVVFEDEPVNMTADEALSTIEAPERDRAKQWLTELLLPGTSIAAIEVQKQAEVEGISVRTLNRAKRELRIVSYPIQTEGKRPQWFWKIE